MCTPGPISRAAPPLYLAAAQMASVLLDSLAPGQLDALLEGLAAAEASMAKVEAGWDRLEGWLAGTVAACAVSGSGCADDDAAAAQAAGTALLAGGDEGLALLAAGAVNSARCVAVSAVCPHTWSPVRWVAGQPALCLLCVGGRGGLLLPGGMPLRGV